MDKEEWKELEKLSSMPYTLRYKELIEKTKDVDEHPGWYSGPCECRTCLSYADC